MQRFGGLQRQQMKSCGGQKQTKPVTRVQQSKRETKAIGHNLIEKCRNPETSTQSGEKARGDWQVWNKVQQVKHCADTEELVVDVKQGGLEQGSVRQCGKVHAELTGQPTRA